MSIIFLNTIVKKHILIEYSSISVNSSSREDKVVPETDILFLSLSISLSYTHPFYLIYQNN